MSKDFKYGNTGPTAVQVLCAFLNAELQNNEKILEKYLNGKLTEKEKDTKFFSMHHSKIISKALDKVFNDFDKIGIWAGMDIGKETPSEVKKYLSAPVVPLKGIIK
tara:strand:- start:905 stop:1222 length:318 start_codon:yes stop_codon:yes gene_type:complete